MEGRLFKYGPDSCHTAFKSGKHKRHLIFVGGLTDGLLATRWIEPLAEKLDAAGWSLVQTLLSSSYLQYGIASLDQDARELDMLVQHLKKEYEATHVVLAGHSTGCQDAVRYVQRFPRSIDGVILQAPVSDREFLATLPNTAARLKQAQHMVKEGRGTEFLPRDTDCAPMSAERYVSLAGRMGDDDMFSWDLSSMELKGRVGHLIATRTLLIMSGADEYVPAEVDKHALAEKLALAMGTSQWVVVEDGNHALSESVDEAVQHMLAFVNTL